MPKTAQKLASATSRAKKRAPAKAAKKAPSRKPLEEISTRDRLKRCAKHLFALRGFEGVTVREILTEAHEKNGASISYYFRSKEGLVEEIITDLFSFLDSRWGQGLKELEASGRTSIRDLISLIVEVSTGLDHDEEPTSARLAESASHQRFHVVLEVMKRHKLGAYDKILTRIASNLPELPNAILRQRLIFLTRYLSTIFSLYETMRVGGTERQRQLLAFGNDLGNVIDTAVGLMTADVKDGGSGSKWALHSRRAHA